MIQHTRRLAAGVAGAIVVATMIAATALAASPTRDVQAVHISTTFPAGTRCPFEVVRTVDGTLVTTTFTGRDGLTKTTFSYKDGKIGYLNPANGKTLAVAGFIVTEAFVSFVGYGVDPDTPTWGNALANSQGTIPNGDWWWPVFPGVAIVLTVLGINFLGDGLRDALDPKSKL